MKRIIYRFALWLENKAYDLQYWAEPPSSVRDPDFDSLVVGAINREPLEFWQNVTENNALMSRLREESKTR